MASQTGLSVLSGPRGLIQTAGIGLNQPMGEYSPEVSTELAQQERKRQIANLLLQQGLSPGAAGEMVGRFYVPKGLGSNLADLAKVAMGAYGNYAANKGEREAIAGETSKRDEIIKALQQQLAPTPATTQIGTNEDQNQYVPPQPPPVEKVQQAILQAQQSRIPDVQRIAGVHQQALNQRITREDMQQQHEKELAAAAALKREQSQAQRDMEERIAKLQVGSKEKVAELPVQPVTVIGKDGKPHEVDARTGRDLGLSAKPELQAQKNEGKQLSPTSQKELFEADDTMVASQNAKTALTRALELNDKAYEGALAGGRAAVMSNIPGAPKEGANAAVDLNNIVTGQALEQLRATFGGMPTEGERKVLLDVQGSVNMTAPQRKEVWERAIKLVERREKIAKERADQLRGGTYFKPQGGPTVPPVDLSQNRRSSDKTRLKFDAQGNPVK